MFQKFKTNIYVSYAKNLQQFYSDQKCPTPFLGFFENSSNFWETGFPYVHAWLSFQHSIACVALVWSLQMHKLCHSTRGSGFVQTNLGTFSIGSSGKLLQEKCLLRGIAQIIFAQRVHERMKCVYKTPHSLRVLSKVSFLSF